jgi:nucleoside-diphosphate-sugar epimerase
MSRILSILLIALGVGAHLPAWALEFTADRITTIDGRTGKDALFYRDDMWRLEHHASGPVGSGQQWMSWLHQADLVGLFLLGLDNSEAKGPLNGVAPKPARSMRCAARS